MNNLYKKFKAFTLIELIVVIVIVSILAVLFIPNIMKSIHQSYAKDAMHNLMTIYAAQQNYYQNNSTYLTCASTDLSACVNSSSGLDLSIISSGGITYTCDATVNPSVCTATGGAQAGTFTMNITLNTSPTSTGYPVYCSGTTYNPCCATANASLFGLQCP